MKKTLLFVLSSLMILGVPLALTSCGNDSPAQDDVNDDDDNGNTNTPTDEAKQVNVVWSGENSTITVDQGSDVDIEALVLEGISAKGEDGTALTVKISPTSNKVNIERAGSTTMTLQAYNGDTPMDAAHNGTLQRRVVVQAGCFIENGTFDNGRIGNDVTIWKNGETGAQVSIAGDRKEHDGCLRIEVSNPGRYWYDNQVEFKGLSTKENVTYLITFDARSTTSRNIGITMEMKDSPYTMVDTVSENGWSQKTTTEWATYQFVVTSEIARSNVKLALAVGYFNDDDAGESTVYIDNIKIEALDKVANSTGVVFEGRNPLGTTLPEEDLDSIRAKDYWTFSSAEEYNEITPMTAKDKDGNPLEVKTFGVTKAPSFGSVDRLWSVFYYTLDSDNNLSYCVRKYDYQAK